MVSVDKIYIINLEHSVDRKLRTTDQLRCANVSNYEFFKGIIPDIGVLQTFPNFCKGQPEQTKLNILGCLLSHIAIMKLAIERGHDNIIVLEDDCRILDNDFVAKVNACLSENEFSNHYDILYLGANHKRRAIEKLNDHLYRTNNGANGTFAYCVSRPFMEELVRPSNYKFPIDVHWKKFRTGRTNKFYCLIPHVVNICDCISVIHDAQTNYEKQILDSQKRLISGF